MEYENQFQKIRKLVVEANQAVIESQGNVDPSKFQHAQNVVLQAMQQIHEFFKYELEDMSEEEQKQLLHVKELTKHLEETLHALAATE